MQTAWAVYIRSVNIKDIDDRIAIVIDTELNQTLSNRGFIRLVVNPANQDAGVCSNIDDNDGNETVDILF